MKTDYFAPKSIWQYLESCLFVVTFSITHGWNLLNVENKEVPAQIQYLHNKELSNSVLVTSPGKDPDLRMSGKRYTGSEEARGHIKHLVRKKVR